MACACNSRGGQAKQFAYVWTDGKNTVRYTSEVKAKVAVIKRGGSYTYQEA